MKKAKDAQADSQSGARSVLKRLVPPVYFEPVAGRAPIGRIVAVALGIRLVLMPIAGHPDLLTSYHRSFALLGDFIPALLMPQEIIQAALLAFCSPFLPLEELIGWDGSRPASHDYWLDGFAPHSASLFALFLFKLPYLIADFAIAGVLLRLFVETPARGLKAASMWLLNPLTIYTFYVLARNDVITIFFLALGLLWLSRGREVRGALAIGVGVWANLYAALLLPLLLAVHSGSRRTKLEMLGAAIAPVALYNLVSLLAADGQAVPALRMLADPKSSSYLLGFRFEMGSHQELFMFPFVYAVLLLLALTAPLRDNLIVRFSQWVACSLMLLYATAFFEPQLITWSVLFVLILRIFEQGSVLRNFHYLQMLVFIPYTFYWGELLFAWHFAPVGPEFVKSIYSPWEVVEMIGTPGILVNLARSLMSATCLFMVGLILFGSREGNSQTA